MTLDSFCGQNNIQIFYVPFNTKIRGFTMPDGNCGTNIVINTSFCPESQKRTLEHELMHLVRNHLYRQEEAAALESEVHDMIHRGYGFCFDSEI